MKRSVTACVVLSILGAGEARADSVGSALEPIEALASVVPAGIGGGVTRVSDGDVGWSFLLTWPMQIPIGERRRSGPPVRFVLEPIASFGSEGTEFQLRAAPRLVITPWRRVGLFATAGTTVRFAPLEPSLHLELGVRYGRDGVVWFGLRGDQWFAGTPEQRLAALVGWSFY